MNVLTVFLASAVVSGLAIVGGAIAALFANRYFPRGQFIGRGTLIYSVRRHGCGCLNINGVLSPCEGHRVMEALEN